MPAAFCTLNAGPCPQEPEVCLVCWVWMRGDRNKHICIDSLGQTKRGLSHCMFENSIVYPECLWSVAFTSSSYFTLL
jgi:hypothetical protein